MKKVFLAVLIVSVLLFSTVGVFAAGWTGYHKNNIFVGTCEQWCKTKFGELTDCSLAAYCGPDGKYLNDKLVMKWNEEWNRGNAEGWANGPYDAWLDNEWNGNCKGCSGEVWHYKIKWVPADDWLYPIWGNFAVIMSQGTDSTGHVWQTHEIPTGYGA